MITSSFSTYLTFFLTLLSLDVPARSSFLAEPAEPLNPKDYSTPDPNTVPAFPVQTQQQQTCRLDLSAELFGGVGSACSHSLDRSRCCPVLAAWLFAAHARSALQLNSSTPLASETSQLPTMPDDSQSCVNSLQNSLQSRNIHIPQPNATCEPVLCFCGIRLHQITSLTCPAAFNVSSGSHNAVPTAAVKNLEKNCRNSSYSGCTRCLGALQKLKGNGKNGSHEKDEDGDRRSRMLKLDCELMGLTWLLARNKTAYIPTVSAVLRAIMYSAHPPHQSKCSPDQENMPLAVDSLQFEKSSSPSNSHNSLSSFFFLLPFLLTLGSPAFIFW